MKFVKIALNPWVVLAGLSLGLLLGATAPDFSLTIAVVGDFYVDLMQIIVLPLLMAAMMLSIQRLLEQGGGSVIFSRAVVVFVVLSLLAVLISGATMLLIQPGAQLPSATLERFGALVGDDLSAHDTAMELHGASPQQQAIGVEILLANIVQAFINDDMLKILIFALVGGLVIFKMPPPITNNVASALKSIDQGSKNIIRWMSYLLPVVLLTLSAGQMATTGIAPLLAMGQFVLAFAAVSLLMVVLAIWLIKLRTQQPLGLTLEAMGGPFALAIATRNSVVCMPIMIEALVDKLGLLRSQVELMVPLSVSLLRIGPMVYYVCATLFIAQLYGHSITLMEFVVVTAVSIMVGLGSIGMTGVAIVPLTGILCGVLGLPFEAAVVLFVAVDPICDMLRTLVLVMANAATVAMICPRSEAETI